MTIDTIFDVLTKMNNYKVESDGDILGAINRKMKIERTRKLVKEIATVVSKKERA